MKQRPVVPETWAVLSPPEVQRLLPHRYPFLMIDRGYLNPDAFECIAFKAVTFNEPYFPGHFPGEPLMPGVLMIEAMAQAAALTYLWRYPEYSGQTMYLLGVDQARFRMKVSPGQLLLIHAWLDRQRGPFLWFRGRIWVDDAVAAEARLSTSTRSNGES